MGGNTGVRRDVLRWLVALNLSFPIKNIKRDFSNGFLVAEIFSRYFPHDIQMHSYDYGTKMEKKRDNWTQLQKFFKKRSFVVMKDEIETIISCQTPDGAGPLLERMYKFLTMKRRKPEEEAEKNEKQQQMQLDWKATSGLASLATNPSVPVSARVDFSQFSRVSDVEGNRIEMSNLTSTTISAENSGAERTLLVCSCIRQGNSHGPPCFNPGCQHFISVSNSFYSIQRQASEQVPGHEKGSGVLLPLQSNVSFSSYGDYNQFKDETDNTPPRSPKRIDCRDENQEKDHDKGSLSAIERARRREIGEHPSSQQKKLNGDRIETIKPGSKTTPDVALAFRSPHRQRRFKQYTISDYRRQQTAACVQLGKLGPDLEDEELGEKREKLERMKEFGRIVRSCNTAQVNVPKKTKTPPLSKRQKALEFAATVPKPKVKKFEVEKPPTPEKNHHQLSELQILEAKHVADRQHVEAMRRELEIFLR